MGVKKIQYSVGDIILLENRTKYVVNRLDDGICNLFTIEKIEGGMVILSEVEGWISINEIHPVPIDCDLAKLVWDDCIIAASVVRPDGIIPERIVDRSPFLEKFKTVTDGNKSYYDIVLEKQFVYVHEVQQWLRETERTSTRLRINDDALLMEYLKNNKSDKIESLN